MIYPGERDTTASLKLVHRWCQDHPGKVEYVRFTIGDSGDYTLTATVRLYTGNDLFVRLDADTSDSEVLESLNRQLSDGGHKPV